MINKISNSELMTIVGGSGLTSYAGLIGRVAASAWKHRRSLANGFQSSPFH